jgi:hypothetical protein
MGMEPNSGSVGDSSTVIGDRRDWQLTSMAAHIAEAAPTPAPMHGIVEQVRRDALSDAGRRAMNRVDKALAELPYPDLLEPNEPRYNDGVQHSYLYCRAKAREVAQAAIQRAYER